MHDHPVRQKLEKHVLPYLVSAKHLKKQWFYLFHKVFGYSTDLVGSLSAIGISTPLLPFFIKLNEPIDPASKDFAVAVKYMDSLPSGVYYVLVTIVIFWLLIRVFYIREDGQKKAVLVTSCMQTFKQIETKLHRILGDQNPMPTLNELLEKEVHPVVDRNVQEGSWPWSGPAPSKEIDKDVNALLEELCKKYQSEWIVPPNTNLRAVPAGG